MRKTEIFTTIRDEGGAIVKLMSQLPRVGAIVYRPPNNRPYRIVSLEIEETVSPDLVFVSGQATEFKDC